MGHGFFIRRLASMYARGWLFAMAALLGAGVAGWVITSDLRWLVVLLMVVLIVAPMLMAFLYFWYGLRKECFSNVVWHDLSIRPEGVSVTLYRHPDPDPSVEEMHIVSVDTAGSDEDKGEERKENEKDTSELPQLERSGSILLEFSEMRPYMVGTDSVTVPIGKGFLWIPSRAFADRREMEAFIARLSEGMRRHVKNKNSVKEKTDR